MESIFNVPQPIVHSILDQLSVEEVWELRSVCKTFYLLCRTYFEERLKELSLNKQWLRTEQFGRTITILRNCRCLKKLSIEIQHSDSLTANKLLSLLTSLSSSNCKLFEYCLKGVHIPDCSLPNVSENLLTIRKLVLENLQSSDWKKLFTSFLRPNIQYTSLQRLSLRLARYDGIDLLQLGNNSPNLTTLDVSESRNFCSSWQHQPARVTVCLNYDGISAGFLLLSA